MILPYNTDQPPVVLPEYGRNIQKLIDYCVTIEDRDERTACAYSIADTMAGMFPELIGEDNDRHKIWDHINIISGFKLDIDFPCEVLTQEKLNPKPAPIAYPSSRIRYRHYGKNIEQMIDILTEMEDGEEKDTLVSMIAHHMKKLMLLHNKEGVADAKILKDLAEYSRGKINLDPAVYLLHEFRESEKPVVKKNKKKR